MVSCPTKALDVLSGEEGYPVTSDVAALIARHEAFWNLEEVDRPLLDVGPYVPMGRLDVPARLDISFPEEGYLQPGMLDAHRLAEQARKDLEGLSPVNGDVFRVLAPYYAVPWIEATCGCPVWYSLPRGSMSAEPLPGGWEEAKTVRVRRDNPWLQKLLDFHKALSELADGGYPVTVPTPMRGPIDLLASAVGTRTASFALIDRPQEAHDLLKRFTEIWIQVVGEQIAQLPRFVDGWVTAYGVWTEGTNAVTQCDLAIMISPQMYAEFLVPCDEVICASLATPIIHIHTGCIHLLDPILTVESFAAIEISIDPHGPDVHQLIPHFQEVQRRGKPLFIQAYGSLTQPELDVLLQALSPRGLYARALLRPTGEKFWKTNLQPNNGKTRTESWRF